MDSDTVLFFDSSIELGDLAHKDFGGYLHYLWNETEAPYAGENRTLFFVKIVSLFALIANNNYWIVSLYFSLFSFFSLWWLTRVIDQFFPTQTWSAVFAFMIYPSCVFWSSGVIKETMAMMSLCFLAGVFVQIWMKRRPAYVQLLMAIISLWILWSLKYYYAALFIPVVSAALLTRWFVEVRMKPTSRSAYREFVLFTVLLMVMFFVVTFIHPNFYPQRILQVIVENYYSFIEASHPDKVIHFYKLEPTLGSIVMNMPWAFLSGLLRPFIWESTNIFQVLVSIENIFLAILIILSIKNIHHLAKSNHRLLLFSILTYCFLLCVLLALSAPNFGTLVRYKIGFLPFFVFLISMRSHVGTIRSKPFNSAGTSL